MCLVTTKPTRTYRDSVVDPPRHSSYYSAHTAGRVSLPRSQRTSYVRSTEYVFPRSLFLISILPSMSLLFSLLSSLLLVYSTRTAHTHPHIPKRHFIVRMWY